MTDAGPELLFESINQAVNRWRGFVLPPAAEAWPQEGAYQGCTPEESPVSDTTLTLLRWWFRASPHELPPEQGNALFRYWPHQRRFVETVIYLL